MALNYPDVAEGRYDPREDLEYTPGYNVQDWISHYVSRMNRPEPMGTTFPSFEYPNRQPNPAQIQELDIEQSGPRLPSVRPEDMERPPGFDDEEDDPRQAFIRMQLAGDVVPLIRPGPYVPPTPKIYSQGARGMDAIQNFQSVGGRPPPDLMNIYNILTGREVGR